MEIKTTFWENITPEKTEKLNFVYLCLLVVNCLPHIYTENTTWIIISTTFLAFSILTHYSYIKYTKTKRTIKK